MCVCVYERERERERTQGTLCVRERLTVFGVECQRECERVQVCAC